MLFYQIIVNASTGINWNYKYRQNMCTRSIIRKYQNMSKDV